MPLPPTTLVASSLLEFTWRSAHPSTLSTLSCLFDKDRFVEWALIRVCLAPTYCRGAGCVLISIFQVLCPSIIPLLRTMSPPSREQQEPDRYRSQEYPAPPCASRGDVRGVDASLWYNRTAYVLKACCEHRQKLLCPEALWGWVRSRIWLNKSAERIFQFSRTLM